MFKSKKEQIIQTKSNKQIESGKKGKTKSPKKRPLLSKFFKNTTKDENTKNKVSDGKENTIQSANTTEKVDVSEKENNAITTQSKVETSFGVSPKYQVQSEVVTREVVQTFESAKEETENSHSPGIISAKEITGKETSHGKSSGNYDTGKSASHSRKSTEETRSRTSSAGKKSPKSPTRKNKRGHPEISDAELVFTTVSYSGSQESAKGDQSFDSTEDTNSPQVLRKADGNEIESFEHHSATISTSNANEVSASSNKLLTPEPLARDEVKSEDMSALIDMLRDLTDSFGAPPQSDPSYFNVDGSTPNATTAPSTTPNEREQEFRLAWQDEAKELSERLLKKIQEIEITSSKENINRESTQRSLDENDDEFVVVSNITNVEFSNVIDVDNENNKELSETSDLQTTESEKYNVELIDNVEATPQNDSVEICQVSVSHTHHRITTNNDISSTKTTLIEKEDSQMDSFTNESTVVHEEVMVQPPFVVVTSDAGIDTAAALEGSTFEDIPRKQAGDEHIVEKKSVVRICGSKKDKGVSREVEVEPAVVIGPVDVSNIEMDHHSPDEVLESSAVPKECVTDVSTSMEVIDIFIDVKSDVTNIHTSTEIKDSSTDTTEEVTDEDLGKTKVDDTTNENVGYTYKHDEVRPPEIIPVGTNEKEYQQINSDDVIISTAHREKEMLVNESQPNHLYAYTENHIDESKTTGSVEIQTSSTVEPETLLVEEKNGPVIITDDPLKKVEDFSLVISENIIKDSLSEQQLMSESPSTYSKSCSLTREGNEESPLSVTQDSTRSLEVDGLIISTTTYSHSIQIPELGENVTMEDLMLKYKDYIDRSDSIEITDALGNISGIAIKNVIGSNMDSSSTEIYNSQVISDEELPPKVDEKRQVEVSDDLVHVTSDKGTIIPSSNKPINESIPTGDGVPVDTSTEYIESPTEITDEPAKNENIQEVESTLVYEPEYEKNLSEHIGDLHLRTEFTSNVDVEEVRGSGHIQSAQDTISSQEVSNTDIQIKHSAIENVRFDNKHSAVEPSQENLPHTYDEVVNEPFPLEILEKIPENADRKDCIGSSRDLYIEVEAYEIQDADKCKYEQVEETVSELPGKEANMMAEQSEMLPSLSEESLQDVSINMVKEVVGRQEVDTEKKLEKLESEKEADMINAALEMEIAKTKIIGQHAAPSITFTNSVVKKDDETVSIANDKEDIDTAYPALEIDFVSTSISPMEELNIQEGTLPLKELLHDETSVIININKSKDDIINDDGFEEKDIDIQIKTNKVNRIDECEDYSHSETTELTFLTGSERTGSVQLVIPIDNRGTVSSKELDKDKDKEQPEVDRNIDVNNKTEACEINQLIREIKEEHKTIYAPEHLSANDQCNSLPEHDSVCEVTRRDQLVEQLLIKMSKAKKLSEEKCFEISTLNKQKAFDADFLLSLINKESATYINEVSSDIHTDYGGDKPTLTRSEGYIEVNQTSITEDPTNRVSKLAYIILKRYQSQDEQIELEIKNPVTSEAFIMVNEAKSYHPDEKINKTESNDINNEQMMKGELIGEIEQYVIEKYEDEPEVDYEGKINYTKEVATGEKLLHDSTLEKIVVAENICANIIQERKEEIDILSNEGNIINFVSDEPVTEECVPCYIIVEESVYENLTPEVESIIEFPSEMDNVENTIDEPRTDDSTLEKIVVAENICANIIHERKEEIDILSDEGNIINFVSDEPVTEECVPCYIIVEESVYENITPEVESIIEFTSEMDNVENTIDEPRTDDFTTPLENVEDAENLRTVDDIESPESIISTVDYIDVELSTDAVVSHAEQPDVVEDPVVLTEKAGNVIDLEVIDDDGSRESVIPRIDIIDVELEERVVVYNEEEEVVVNEDLVKPLEKTPTVIDLKISDGESLEPIASTDGQIEVELQPSVVVCYDNHPVLLDGNLVECIENISDNESPESITCINHLDDVELKTTVVINNDITPTVADEDQHMEIVDRSIDLEKIDDNETPALTILTEDHIAVDLNPPVNVNNVDIPVIIDDKVVVPVEKVDNVIDLHIHDDIESPESLTVKFDIDHVENESKIIEISEPSAIGVGKEEIQKQIVISEQVIVNDSITSDKISNDIIDEEMRRKEGTTIKNDFDDFDAPVCDMITIFKALRSQIESITEGTPLMKGEAAPVKPEEVQLEPIKDNDVIEESSVGYIVVEVEKTSSTPAQESDIPHSSSDDVNEISTPKEITVTNNGLVNEEFLTEVDVSQEESEISFLEQTSVCEKLVPEEKPTSKEDALRDCIVNEDMPTKEVVGEEYNATLRHPNDIESELDNKDESPNSSPNTSHNVNAKQKLKKRPNASFRKISTETDTSLLSDKIKKSIECDTNPLHTESPKSENELASDTGDEHTPSSEDDVKPTSSEPEIGGTKTDEDEEEEKPLYIVCKDVRQTNIITSSRARVREDEEGSFISRTPSPATPSKHSPIIRLTSTPSHDVQNTPTTVTNENIEYKVAPHENKVIVQTQFFYEQGPQGISVCGNVHREDPEQRKIGTSNNYVINTEIVDAPKEDLVVASIENLQEGEPNTYLDEDSGTKYDEGDFPEIDTINLKDVSNTDNDNYEEEDGSINNFMSLLTINGGVEPVLEKVESHEDEIIPQQIEDGITERIGNWGETHTDKVSEINIPLTCMDEIDYVPPTETNTEAIKERNIEGGKAAPLPKYKVKISPDNDSIQQHSTHISTINSVDTICTLNTPVESKKVNCEVKTNLLIDNGRLVEQPDDQMYRQRQEQKIPKQTITLTSTQLPKYQNIYVEMRSKGEVPVDDDIDPYLSEIHLKDIANKWQDPQLLSPTYTSSEEIIINGCPKTPTNKVQSVCAVPGATDVYDNNNSYPAQSTNYSNDANRSSSEVTFNKDVHESLQIFCDGLLTGLFKANEVCDEVALPGTETTIKIKTDLKPIKDISREKNNKQDIEKASGRVFKCDEAMLRQELQDSLHHGDTTTK